MADERVPPVMDGQRLYPFRAEHPARRQEPPPNRMALQRLAATVRLDRTDERISAASALSEALGLPRSHGHQRARVPPQGDETRPPALRPAPQTQM
jgi:hypothetical protein